MSLLDVTEEIKTLLRTGPLEYATLADIYLDGETLHYSDLFHSITLNNGDETATYAPLGDRIIPPDQIETQQSLDDSTIEVSLDSSRISDGNDPVGALIDNTIAQRRVRLRTVLFQPDTSRTDPLWLFNTRNGVIDRVGDMIKIGNPSTLKLTAASGFFAYLERRLTTYSHTYQTDIHPGDTGFEYLPQLIDLQLPWRGEFRAGTGYIGGGGGSGGGGLGVSFV